MYFLLEFSRIKVKKKISKWKLILHGRDYKDHRENPIKQFTNV